MAVRFSEVTEKEFGKKISPTTYQIATIFGFSRQNMNVYAAELSRKGLVVRHAGKGASTMDVTDLGKAYLSIGD